MFEELLLDHEDLTIHVVGQTYTEPVPHAPFEPATPNQVWRLDFSEFETTSGGTWRLAGCPGYRSNYEHRERARPRSPGFRVLRTAGRTAYFRGDHLLYQA